MVEAVSGAGAVVADSVRLAERNLRVLLIQIRSMPQATQHEIRCIRRCAGLLPEQLLPWNVVERPELRWEHVRHADAIVIGGSGDHSVTQDYPFMPCLEEVLQRAAALGKPLFGICWGHHMLARALGGLVETEPANEEIGTFEVELTPEGVTDPLFEGLPSRFDANLVHHDSIALPAPGFCELAFTETCRFQVMRLAGKPVYGTQFHGEMTREDLRRRLLMYRAHYLDTDEQAESVVESLRPTQHAQGLLRRFLELYT